MFFGFNVYAFIVYEKRKKLDKRSKKYTFVGYKSQYRGYMIYSPSSKVVFISRDVKINELLKEFISYEDMYDFEFYITPKWMDINVDKSPQ